jgi:hypothetical protein
MVVLVTALVLAGVAARAVPALRQPLWLDEVVSARIITQPTVGKSVSQVRKTESSPPGWHLANWALWRLVGKPARLEWLRLLSVVFGGALIALVVAYGRGAGLSRLGALVAGALAAFGPNVVAHGAELRPYAALTLLALVFAMVLERAARSPTWPRLAWLTAVVVVGSYTHYFFLLSVATGIGWALVRLAKDVRRRVLGAIGIGLIPFLVWLPSFHYQYKHNLYAYNGSFNLRTVAYSYARIVGLLGQAGAVDALIRVLFAVIVLAGAVMLIRQREGELAALMVVVPVALTALIWLLGPHIFNERNLLVSLPFAAVSVGKVIGKLPRPSTAVLLVTLASVVAVSLWDWEVDYGRSSYNGIAKALTADGWQSNDEIVQFGLAPLGLSQPVGWYLPGRPRLTGAKLQACGSLFAVSYDGAAGDRWIAAHLLPGSKVQMFKAYDHTPRGPSSPQPIYVGRLSGGLATASNAIANGARLIHAEGASCG